MSHSRFQVALLVSSLHNMFLFSTRDKRGASENPISELLEEINLALTGQDLLTWMSGLVEGRVSDSHQIAVSTSSFPPIPSPSLPLPLQLDPSIASFRTRAIISCLGTLHKGANAASLFLLLSLAKNDWEQRESGVEGEGEKQIRDGVATTS